jgi:hypothetical protein
MGNRAVGVADQAPGAGVAEVRARERDIGGSTYAEQYVIPIEERVASYKGMVSSFRTLGNAASPQNLFTIANTSGSAVLVAVRRLSIQMEATAASTALAVQFKTSRSTTVPTGGTSISKVAFDTSLTSAANVELRGATASDGGAATAITATANAIGWHQFGMRLHTAVGQVLCDDASLIPSLSESDPVILRAAEGLLVQVTNVVAANNLATNHYIVNCMWEEFTLP